MEFLKSEKQINDAVSKHVAVTAYLDELTFEMLAQAQVGLVEHRQDGNASVEREHRDVDWYVILSDERGQGAAMSIEYGHGEYTRTVTRKDGSTFEVTIPASQPTYILTNATKIAKKQRRVSGGDL